MSEKVPNEPPPAYPGTGGYPSAPINYGGPPSAPTTSELYAGGPPQQYPSPQYPSQPYSQYPPPQPHPAQFHPPQHHPPQNYQPAPRGVVSAQPTTIAQTTVVVAGRGDCPACGIGYRMENFSVLGIICAIFCFPWGLICLFLCKDRRCSHCGLSFE